MLKLIVFSTMAELSAIELSGPSGVDIYTLLTAA